VLSSIVGENKIIANSLKERKMTHTMNYFEQIATAFQLVSYLEKDMEKSRRTLEESHVFRPQQMFQVLETQRGLGAHPDEILSFLKLLGLPHTTLAECKLMFACWRLDPPDIMTYDDFWDNLLPNVYDIRQKHEHGTEQEIKEGSHEHAAMKEALKQFLDRELSLCVSLEHLRTDIASYFGEKHAETAFAKLDRSKKGYLAREDFTEYMEGQNFVFDDETDWDPLRLRMNVGSEHVNEDFIPKENFIWFFTPTGLIYHMNDLIAKRKKALLHYDPKHQGKEGWFNPTIAPKLRLYQPEVPVKPEEHKPQKPSKSSPSKHSEGLPSNREPIKIVPQRTQARQSARTPNTPSKIPEPRVVVMPESTPKPKPEEPHTPAPAPAPQPQESKLPPPTARSVILGPPVEDRYQNLPPYLARNPDMRYTPMKVSRAADEPEEQLPRLPPMPPMVPALPPADLVYDPYLDDVIPVPMLRSPRMFTPGRFFEGGPYGELLPSRLGPHPYLGGPFLI
jgi:hypothetical protein